MRDDPLEAPVRAIPWTGALLAAGGFALASSAFVGVFADGLWRLDGFDYAQIGRELAEGRGFSSVQAIYALHLRFLLDHDLLNAPWPSLHRFPLPSLLLAGAFRAFGASDAVVHATGIALLSATAGLLYAMTHQLAGRAAAVAASVLFTGSARMLEVAGSGLSEPPAMLCFTASAFLLWRGSASGRLLVLAAAGVAFGLAAASRTSVLFALPVFGLFALWAAWRRGGAASALAAGAVFGLTALLPLLPWWIRNLAVAGSPLFSLHSFFLLPAGPYPGGNRWDLGNDWVRDFVPALDWGRTHAGLVWAKWRNNGLDLLADFPRLAGGFGAPLLALAALGTRSAGPRALAWLVLPAFALSALLTGVTDRYFDKYYFHFVPVLLALGASMGLAGLRRLRVERAGWILVGLALVSAAPWQVVAAGREVTALSRRPKAEHMSRIQELTPASGIVLSDQSWAIAWLARRRSVRQHFFTNEAGRHTLAALRLRDEGVPISGVYLSRDYLRLGPWRAMLDQQRRDPRFAEAFPEVVEFEDGALFFHAWPRATHAPER